MDQVCDTWRAGVERIITNLERVKLKLDEAFFYLDEIEELIQEGDFGEEEATRVSKAGERLAGELSGLGAKVVELKEILVALAAREEEEDGGN
ncbi:MAG: hypothetical protein BWY79_00364 [Actinobacteria bacterium ADurb.Bin444]|nr:MAG: hypothetical protein BWY79_00364 [Actinobacteria bacterium ADurb.Bin444]